MSVRATVLLGVWLVGLMSTELPSVGCCQSCYCPIGLLSGRASVFWISVHRATVCRGCVLGEVSAGLVSGRASVRIPFVRCSLCKILSEIVLIKLFTMDLYSLISCVPMRNRFTQECDCASLALYISTLLKRSRGNSDEKHK